MNVRTERRSNDATIMRVYNNGGLWKCIRCQIGKKKYFDMIGYEY